MAFSYAIWSDMFCKFFFNTFYILYLFRMFPVKFCLFFPRRQAAVWSFQSNLFYIYDTTLLCWHRVWSRNFLEWNLQSLFFSIFHIRQCLVSCATSQFLYQGKFESKIIFLILTLKRLSLSPHFTSCDHC